MKPLSSLLKKRDEILAKCKDEAEKERTAKLIRKMLRGRDIKRYSYEWAGLWVIGTFPSLKIDIEQYSSLKSYLSKFLPRIKQSGEKGCRKKTSNKWFETQDSIAYYQEFEKEKIVYPNMNKEFIAFFDNEFLLLNQKCFILSHQSNNKKELLYLTALLNSNVNFYYFKQIGAKLGTSGYEMSKIFVEKLPIPKINSKNEKLVNELISLVDEILNLKEQDKKANTKTQEDKINSIVYKLYNLTEEEIKIIGDE